MLDINHNVSPERTVFCYRQNDSSSLSVAQYYKNQRFIPDNNLISLPCVDDDEITFAQFRDQILSPLRTAITNIENNTGGVPIYCIILGFNIPKVYTEENGDKVAVAGRLHRLNYDYEPNKKNHTFDRKTFKFFDERDATELYITAVIDGPTVNDAINLIDRSIFVNNQNYVGGKIFLDPYGLKITEQQLNYQQEILDFIEYDVSYLGSEYSSTYDIDDPYQDPSVSYLMDDSFYWGWKDNIISVDAFKDSRAPRAFLYNADDDSASDIKEALEESGSWLNIALQKSNPGYAASAGAVDLPDNENYYLMPRPFFNTLQHYSALGEAFLSSKKYVNDKLILVGDPLMTVNFPLSYTDAKYTVKEIIYRVIRAIEDYLARVYRLNLLTTYIINLFLYTPSFDRNDLFYANVDWFNLIGNYDLTKSYVSNMVIALIRYQNTTTEILFNEWLVQENVKVSDLFKSMFNELSSQTIPNTSVNESGYWEIDFTYTHTELTLEDIHFVIEISEYADFSTIFYQIFSANSQNGWLYEKEIGIFEPLPATGFPSNYSGRRTRYQSPSNYLLSVGSRYYYRIYVDDSSEETVVSATEKIV